MNAEQFDQLDRPQRRHGIALLTRNGADNNLRCFSRYGWNTKECAPVAWRLAYVFSRETGEPITSDLLQSMMGHVVNDDATVAELIRAHGHYEYR